MVRSSLLPFYLPLSFADVFYSSRLAGGLTLRFMWTYSISTESELSSLFSESVLENLRSLDLDLERLDEDEDSAPESPELRFLAARWEGLEVFSRVLVAYLP